MAQEPQKGQSRSISSFQTLNDPEIRRVQLLDDAVLDLCISDRDRGRGTAVLLPLLRLHLHLQLSRMRPIVVCDGARFLRRDNHVRQEEIEIGFHDSTSLL